MKRFNIIKKSRNKSKGIDEKIEYLDKECQKTGLQEVMTTSNIYVGTEQIPNTTYTDVESISIGGYAIGLSGAKGSVGGASIGSPAHSNQTGVALSPPHPVTGARRAAYHVTTGLGDLTALRPGQITYRGFGNNPPPYTMGGALWFFDPTAHGGEGYWYNLEWGNFTNKTGWGFWDTIETGQFAGISFFNTDLSQHSSGGGSLGTEINDKISGINFGINGEVGTPTTTIFIKNDLGDPNFLPINIEGVSSQAFDYLKSAANANLDAAKSAYYAAGGQMPWSYLDPKDKERWLKQAGKGTEVASSLSGGGYGDYFDVGGGDYRGIDQILRMYNDPDKDKKYPDRMLKNIDQLMIDLDLVQNGSRYSDVVSDIDINPGLGAKPGDQLAFGGFGGGNNKPFDPTKKQNRKTTINLINAVNSGDPGFLPPGVTMDQAREFVNNRDSGSLRETFKLRDFKPELKNEDVIDNTKFNVIKKSRKKSKGIDEKIEYLNKECQKTGLQEVMTTTNMYTVVQTVPAAPAEFDDVPDVDSVNGITSDNWTQPLGNDDNGNPASEPPTTFPRIWDNPGYSDPTDGLLNKNNLTGDGTALPIYKTDDLTWQDPSEVPAGAVGGMQIEVGGMDPGIVGGYLDSNGWQTTTGTHIRLGAPNFKTHPHLFKPVKYWHPFSIYHPYIDSYWPGGDRTPKYGGIVKGSLNGPKYALFTAYMYVGGGRNTYQTSPNTHSYPIVYQIDSLGDPLFLPIDIGRFGLSPQGFYWLKDRASSGYSDDTYNWYVKTYGAGAAGWYMNNPNSHPSNNPFLPRDAYTPFTDRASNPTDDKTEIALPPAAILAAMAALGIAIKGAESAWKLYRKYKQQIDQKVKEMQAAQGQTA